MLKKEKSSQGNLVRKGQVESYYPTIFYLATGKTEQLANQQPQGRHLLRRYDGRRLRRRMRRRAVLRAVRVPARALWRTEVGD